MIDMGANVDCKPEWLAQFAMMGSIHAETMLGCTRPRLALLSNGEEEGKGNSLIRDTVPLIEATELNYIGSIEPKEMVRGVTDVAVCDGFVGNMVTKSLEAMGFALFDAIRESVRRSWRAKIGGLLMRPMIRSVYKQHDPAEVGGALLLGVNGVVIIGHGRSDARAVKNALRQAHQAIQGNILQAIRDGIATK